MDADLLITLIFAAIAVFVILKLRSVLGTRTGFEKKNEPYIIPCGSAGACNLPKTITIPPGMYFMMGDNRGASDDSRFWGPVPKEWIIGEAFATYWPPDRIGFL